MEKQSCHTLSTAIEEKCHGEIQVILVRVLCPRPTPSRPSLSGHGAELRNQDWPSPVSTPPPELGDQEDCPTLCPTIHFWRPCRTKQAPPKKHPQTSRSRYPKLGTTWVARGKSWGKESELCTVSRSWSSPLGETGSHPFLTPATQTRRCQ